MRLAAALLALAVPAMAAGGYHFLKKIPVTGDYGWDYLAIDGSARRLVSHDREVVVIDIDSYSVVGKIPDTPGVHGIAIAHDLGRGFITNGTPGSVSIFELKILKTAGQVKVGENPNCVQFEPKTKRVFTADRGSQRVSAIDAKTGKLVGTIDQHAGRWSTP